MAATWVARANAVPFTLSGSILDVFNASGSARVVRAYLLYMRLEGVGAANSVDNSVNVYLAGGVFKTSASSGGSAVTPVAFDTTSTALASQITAGSIRMAIPSATLRTFMFATSFSTIAAGDSYHSLFMSIPYSEWGRYGLDANAPEPIVCRAGEGASVGQVSSTHLVDRNGQGNIAGEIIFTDASS